MNSNSNSHSAVGLAAIAGQWIVGGVYLFSAIAKSVSASWFGTLLASYGFEWLYYAAPAVILFESVLALALITNFRPRLTALLSMAAILFFTSVYSYGLLFRQIDDCGCFGQLHFLPTSTAFFYTRNAILFLLSAFLFLHNSRWHMPRAASLALWSAALIAVSFLIGQTYDLEYDDYNSQGRFNPIPLESHILDRLVELSPDSTYIVTFFSYGCPHCINSFGNLALYEKTGVVDHVIGVGVANEHKSPEIKSFFQPDFRIIDMPLDTIGQITRDFPLSFFVKNDTIVGTLEGEVISPFFLRRKIKTL